MYIYIYILVIYLVSYLFSYLFIYLCIGARQAVLSGAYREDPRSMNICICIFEKENKKIKENKEIKRNK